VFIMATATPRLELVAVQSENGIRTECHLDKDALFRNFLTLARRSRAKARDRQQQAVSRIAGGVLVFISHPVSGEA
jgi:hypothetical protein